MAEQVSQLGGQPIDAQRLLNAYARGLRRYLASEKALAEAVEPIPAEIVYEHDSASEDFQTLRGILRASIKRSEALHVTEDSDA